MQVQCYLKCNTAFACMRRLQAIECWLEGRAPILLASVNPDNNVGATSFKLVIFCCLQLLMQTSMTLHFSGTVHTCT